MSADINVKELPQQILKQVRPLLPYLPLIYFVTVVLIGAFLIFEIKQFTSIEPSETQISEKSETLKKPHIDQASIDKLQQLEDQNIQVQTLFKNARDNPFSE